MSSSSRSRPTFRSRCEQTAETGTSGVSPGNRPPDAAFGLATAPPSPDDRYTLSCARCRRRVDTCGGRRDCRHRVPLGTGRVRAPCARGGVARCRCARHSRRSLFASSMSGHTEDGRQSRVTGPRVPARHPATIPADEGPSRAQGVPAVATGHVVSVRGAQSHAPGHHVGTHFIRGFRECVCRARFGFSTSATILPSRI